MFRKYLKFVWFWFGNYLSSHRPTDRLLTNTRARPKGFRNKFEFIICWIKALAVRPPDRSASHKRRGPAERSNEDDDDDDDDDEDDDVDGDDDGDDVFVLLNRPHPKPYA